jgi:hypothetical protein
MRWRRGEMLRRLDGGAHLSQGGEATGTFHTCAGSGLRRCRSGRRKGDRRGQNEGDSEQPHTRAQPVPDQRMPTLSFAHATRSVGAFAPTSGGANTSNQSSISLPTCPIYGMSDAKNPRKAMPHYLISNASHVRIVALENSVVKLRCCNRPLHRNSYRVFYGSQSSNVITTG